MSRSYRVSVRERQNRTIRAEDHVSTQLEMLEVLPPDQTAGLLADELAQHGFERDGTRMTRKQNGVTITIETTTGTVTVAAEECEEATVEAERSDRAYDDVGPHAKTVRENLKRQVEKDIERKVDEKTAGLQSKVTDRLEGELSELRQELDQVVNRVTAEALKRKAAQMGRIKEMTEDPQAGSLTIVVEV
jgi:formylmethanofuran dehydrogenase subunit E-like metal-binding protein